jgi:nucleotide-binding universal stress UspA family protein
MKTILAPTDFSASSINAVNYAADLALSINAQLEIFNAVQFPVAVTELSMPESVMDEIIDLGNSDLEELVNKLKKRTREKISISSEVMFGPVEEQIEIMSARKRPLAIVMGIKPGKTFLRGLMGSTLFHTMNYIPYPLLIIPENFQFSQIREIGLACDLENIEENIPFESINEWLSLFKARLNIVYVSVKNKEFSTSQLTESISLQNRFASFKPQFHFLKGSNLEDELNHFAKLHTLDLLIVMPRTYGMFSLFHKKHSKNLIRHNHVPILSIHELPARN